MAGGDANNGDDGRPSAPTILPPAPADLSAPPPPPPQLPVGRARVNFLYEQYVHLPQLQQVWQTPQTPNPQLEPVFAAAMHGVELGFLLLSEFLSDSRAYVARRPRVERVAADVAAQCRLLTAVVDGELEEEEEEDEEEEGGGAPPAAAQARPQSASSSSSSSSSSARRALRSLTQPFPFPDAPPTTASPPAEGCSPGLARLAEAVRAAVVAAAPGTTTTTATTPRPLAAPHSLTKLVLNVSAALASFDRWTVGLGLEPQLDALRAAVGLAPMATEATTAAMAAAAGGGEGAGGASDSDHHPRRSRRLFLDYAALVRPDVVLRTLTAHTYSNPEDYFFRAVHLGTECWAKVALERLQGARELAAQGRWHAAAARCGQAAAVLDYLGDHVLLLTTMNLRDYLELKVEIEGTSGEGSAQVKALRPAVRALLEPVERALLGGGGPSSLPDRLLDVYSRPDTHRALYTYCQALEACESALLGGFYFKHYRLATHVIGSDAKGTMKRAVAALKGTYERAVFPELDGCRVELGRRTDVALMGIKGRIMDGILQVGVRAGGKSGSSGGGSAGSGGGGGGCPFGHGRAPDAAAPAAAAEKQHGGNGDGGGCPFAAAAKAATTAAATAAPAPPSDDDKETATALARLYSWQDQENNSAFRERTAARAKQIAAKLGLAPHPRGARGLATAAAAVPLSFLDHAWGAIPPRALEQALQDFAAMAALGNPSWDAAFGRVIPEAARNVLAMLRGEEAEGSGEGGAGGAEESGVSVQFAHNSHELVFRLLSGPMMRGDGEGGVLRVLTSDCEFYSLARQLNALSSSSAAAGDAGRLPLIEVLPLVPADPPETFEQRCLEAVREASSPGPVGAVLVSAVTYLHQRTLVRDPPGFARRIAEAAAAGPPPLVIVDAYHAFSALPLPLLPPRAATDSIPDNLVVVAGLLKHAGCGPNAAYAALSPKLAAKLEPLHTGWLADPSVLAPGATGVRVLPSCWKGGEGGGAPAYCPGFELAGATPAFLLPLLILNRAAELRRSLGKGGALSSRRTHCHVMALQRRFLAGLGRLEAAESEAAPGTRSPLLLPLRTLVGRQPWKDADEDDDEESAARSHTLVFDLGEASEAKRAVDALSRRGVLVDCRSGCVRVGLGPAHDEADVDALLEAVREASSVAAA